MKKYPPLNCTILCKIEKITKKYVTIETVETRDPDSGPIVGGLTMIGPNEATFEIAGKESGALPVRTWIDIAHHGNPEETVDKYRAQLIRDRKRGLDDFYPRFVGALDRDRCNASITLPWD
jgi:hypothetical protein